MKDLIYFAHGNGFPSPCYRQFLSALEPKYNYCYIDQIGHNPDYPITNNWDFLVDEILDNIRSQTTKSVIAVGHSLGGALCFLAAVKDPSLFKMVIMLDSPLLGGLKSYFLWLAKVLGFIDNVTPASQTKGRRQHWNNFDELMAYLKSRPLFKDFDESCLLDYIEYGLVKNNDGYHLRFDREVEYAIFRTIPHTLPELKGKLHTPAALIYGERSKVVTASDRRYMKKQFRTCNVKMKGGHLFPFEDPKGTADKVLEVIEYIASKLDKNTQV